MNAVVLTVKSCYVASTKYSRLSVTEKGGDSKTPKVPLVWKMKVRYENDIIYDRSYEINFQRDILISIRCHLDKMNSLLLNRL